MKLYTYERRMFITGLGLLRDSMSIWGGRMQMIYLIPNVYKQR